MATRKFKCKVCGYVHEGDKAPDKCPVCGAPTSEFEEIMEKKKLNTNSNSYTVIYAAGMVVLVAFLLVFVSSVLKERQDVNVKQDTQQQILSSLNMRDLNNVGETFVSVIKADYLLQADGSMVQNDMDDNFCTNYKGEFDNGRYHIFQADVDGQVKYVIPMNGLGLWGVIWGYIALDEDRSTIYGVYFSHASETPGLGAEIATTAFQERFIGKKLTKNGVVALDVMKFGQAKDSEYEVDGVTGATITSKGVNSMISTVLSSYLPFFDCEDECRIAADSMSVSNIVEE